MAANQYEPALRYLLQLSDDIESALLLDPDGKVLASVPEAAPMARSAAAEMLEAAHGLRNGGNESIEIDALYERDFVFLVSSNGFALVCVAGRLSLPGIVLHEMRLVLSDLSAESSTSGGGG
jgi:hypothetical protein